jgi:regulator of protease activity HflC (stomatin/prohibitin superfamily)
MRVDLDDETANIEALPRFQRAAFQSRNLYRFALGLGLLYVALLLLALFVDWIAPGSLWLSLLCNNSAALLMLIAGIQSARQVAVWRAEAITLLLASRQAPSPEEAGPQPNDVDTAALPPKRLQKLLQKTMRHIGVNVLWLTGLSLIVLLVVRAGWNFPAQAGQPDDWAYIGIGLLILAAFALLVLERHLVAYAAGEWPEAASLAALVRVVIAVQLLSVPCLLFAGATVPWPGYLATLIGLLPALVALELLLRGLLSLFNPRRDRVEPRLVGDSIVAAQLQWPPRPLQLFQNELQQRFGIDLRQIWAFSFMRRAFLPILASLLVIGWLLTGVTEIATNARGIYERFGKPIKVIAPGLNLGLPWPFGRVLTVENGVVHELTTGADTNSAVVESAPAEGPAPDSANRLWDAFHPSEKSQVIAGISANKQSFQIVNMDVRFIYRIGLHDQAAMDATYNTDDVPALIRSTANRVLVHDFASRTLDDVLGNQRSVLSSEIGKVVQTRLDQMHSGVEILAIVIEAIHPPAGAANAYHQVQAAQIAAQALIARERGQSAARLDDAQLNASLVADGAAAAAHENLALAQAADLRFSAERESWQNAGQAFLTETYFNQLNQSFGKASVLILDHRIDAGEPPTLDLRSFAAPLDAPAPKAK